ncbi:hypothetical protein E1091_03470 [Micromonospora fluostatini]|uniref:DUF8033 domain-containing protein n=1 Tax=Micromonospora fluostatini TaxID=1629071 RepID=A0ABY2DNM8_9ACTN|nr:hypothetical protein E1091_03470 [Micromonospora fluostatini]
MATHGAARRRTISALTRREAFRRPGFAMSATTGKVWDAGRLSDDDRKAFEADRDGAGITYTVLSWATPIAWVTTDGTVRVPDTYYSRTTSTHQGLCRTYL